MVSVTMAESKSNMAPYRQRVPIRNVVPERIAEPVGIGLNVDLVRNMNRCTRRRLSVVEVVVVFLGEGTRSKLEFFSRLGIGDFLRPGAFFLFVCRDDLVVKRVVINFDAVWIVAIRGPDQGRELHIVDQQCGEAGVGCEFVEGTPNVTRQIREQCIESLLDLEV